MKKIFIALALALTMTGAVEISAQKHRHNPDIVNNVTDTVGIVAYSDTTGNDAADSTGVAEDFTGYTSDDDADIDNPFALISSLTSGNGGGIVVAVFFILLCVVVVLSPFILVAAIIYMLVKRSDRKYRMMEKAVESGQPIPQEIVSKIAADNSQMWAKGIKNIFTGLGLVVFFYILGAGPITGVGWLVFFCGVGQAVIARTTAGRCDGHHESIGGHSDGHHENIDVNSGNADVRREND